MKTRAQIVALIVVVFIALFLWRAWGQREAGPEPVRFSHVQPELFGDGGTLTDAWADFDGDGDPDRFVGFNGTASRLYRNDGRSRFVDVAQDAGLHVERSVRTSAWGDFDADGDPDLLLGYAGDAPVTALWRNEGAGAFVEIAESVGLRLEAGVTRQAVWVDFDGDGDLDLFLAMRDGPNRLFENTSGSFMDITEASGIGDARRSVGAVWFDVDTDGDLDTYVANMNGDANGLWINTDGRFTDRADEWGLADGGRALGDESQGTVRPCVVDYDHDGQLDIFTANYGPNGLFRNTGDELPWEPVADAEGLAFDGRYDTCAWADFDHDGRVDLYVNGTVTGGTSYRDWLLRREDGAFVDVTPPELLVEADHGATWVDHDLDGDVDLALTGAQDTGVHHLAMNLLRPEYAFHSIKVRVLDAEGHATRVGNEIRVFAAGTFDVLATASVDSGSGYDGQSDLPVHFGLPGGQPVDLEITTILAGSRFSTRLPGIDPRAYRGRVLTVRLDAQGQLVR